jgi:hypothetical protein
MDTGFELTNDQKMNLIFHAQNTETFHKVHIQSRKMSFLTVPFHVVTR